MSMPTSTTRAQQQQQQQQQNQQKRPTPTPSSQAPPIAPVAAAPPAAPFAALTLKNIKSSLIVCGRVSGAIHLTNLAHSVVVVSSTRQFRMHECRDVTVYLACASRPIIEDCVGVRFAPCPSIYAEAAGEASTEAKEEASAGAVADATGEPPAAQPNLWNQVDDFKWLKAGAASPNWRALAGDERVADAVWRDLVPGGPELGVDDILRAVGVGVGGAK
ncbi:tubulin binding cofactor C-domain-containing protein [Phyllosticta citrichinensis]